MFFQLLFCWLRNRHSQRSNNSVARFGIKTCRFHWGQSWVAENKIFGTQQAVWKERLWGKSVLEKNIRTVAFTSSGSLWLLWFRIFIQSSERKVSGTGLWLIYTKLYWCRISFPMPVCSKCTAASLRTTTSCELLHAQFNVLYYRVNHNFYSAHHKILQCAA